MTSSHNESSAIVSASVALDNCIRLISEQTLERQAMVSEESEDRHCLLSEFVIVHERSRRQKIEMDAAKIRITFADCLSALRGASILSHHELIEIFKNAQQSEPIFQLIWSNTCRRRNRPCDPAKYSPRFPFHYLKDHHAIPEQMVIPCISFPLPNDTCWIQHVPEPTPECRYSESNAVEQCHPLAEPITSDGSNLVVENRCVVC